MNNIDTYIHRFVQVASVHRKERRVLYCEKFSQKKKLEEKEEVEVVDEEWETGNEEDSAYMYWKQKDRKRAKKAWM